MLEDAVAKAVPADVGLGAAARQRRGRPEVAALLVAEVQGFAARIAHGIVVPGSEAELVSVLAPGVGRGRSPRSTVPKCGFASTFTHGAGVTCPVRGRNDVLAPIRRESAEPVEEDQIARGNSADSEESGLVAASRLEARNWFFHRRRDD